jgi:LuxR family maltose regulon positive regulatory protein
MHEAQHCVAAFIIGSAGSGKTVLLVQHRQELMMAGAEVAWLTLSPDDRCGSSVCGYLLAALEKAGIQIDSELLADGGTGEGSIESAVAAIVAGAQRIARQIYLFIDDYHYVEDPCVHQLVQKLLNHSPENLHFVIASRVTPPLTVSRLRVYGQVVDITSADLAFTLVETKAFFELSLGTLKLTDDELRLIHDLTHGWPASLQLIAIMLRNRPAAREQLRAFLWRSGDLQAYLAEDVISHSPPALIEFLEMMSIFRRFNVVLAAFVTGDEHAADLLRRAEEENLLIQRVESDDRLPWYRLHPLLGEFLAGRLAQRGKATVEALHRRGSRWFANHDLLAEAVRHANLGADLPFAMSVIEQAVPANWNLGYIGPLLHLLERLPEESLATHPRLFFLGCLTYALTGRPFVAQRWLDQLRRTDAARDPAVADKLALAEAAIATQRDDSERVIELLENARGDWPEHRLLRYVYIGALANAYAGAGRIEDANRLLENQSVDTEDSDNELALLVQSTVPHVHLLQGNVDKTARLASDILAHAESSYGRRSVCSEICAALLGDAYFELGRTDEARAVLANRPGILRAASPEVMIRASLCHARLDLLQHGCATALDFLDAQAAHFQGLGLDRPLAHMLAEQLRIQLADGDHVRAAGVLARLEVLGNAHRESRGYLAEIPALAALAHARMALVNCDIADALNALDVVHDFARTFGRTRLRVQADLLSAACLNSLEQHEQARAYLLAAVQTGEELQLRRVFIDESAACTALLDHLRDDETLPPSTAQYLNGLLDRPGAPAAPKKRVTRRGELATPGINLTPREREILLLISQAMSNKRIALTLNITVGTTKWNVRNILTKLGVSTRYDAMMWAKANGFID